MEPPTVPGAGESITAGEPASILARIDARERQIERTLHEARETAAALVRGARTRAEEIAAGRREQAAREAAELGERIVADARRGAEAILAGGAGAAAVLRATPQERIARAAAGLLAVVLPSDRAGGGRR